uniref:Uncharacterized protein n=1 Tax=Schistosoma japonicum TaxID=6182 RepID=Q5BX27_SCHJA|nr:unknown [Schistosoma japonicum]
MQQHYLLVSWNYFCHQRQVSIKDKHSGVLQTDHQEYE